MVAVLASTAFLAYGYFWSPEERYNFKLNFMTEGMLRKEIENAFYFEMHEEGCNLNKFQYSGTQEECGKCMRCFAEELSNIVAKNDLRELAKDMEQGNRAESAVIEYFQNHKNLEEEFKKGTERCPCTTE